MNHYNFRTYALDLGAYTNAMYDYIHFQWNDSLVFKIDAENLLADHFDLYLIIFSPLSLIFGSYTLLIVQIAAILMGGYGVFRYFKLITHNPVVPLAACLGFFLFFAIFSALAFDYHSNVVAAMLLPWFFYFLRAQKPYSAVFLFLFLIVAKENISLWLFFVCIGLLFEYYKGKKTRFLLISLAAFSLVYFYLVIGVIMPAISNAGAYPHFEYAAIGQSPIEALGFIVTHPIDTIHILFTNHTGSDMGDYVKTELWLFVLLSGGFLLFFRPHYLLMLIPILFQKLLHDDVLMWGVGDQYAIEFTPVVIIGGFTTISRLRSVKWQNACSVLTLVLILTITIRRADNTYAYTDHSRIRLYQKQHWAKGYEVNKIHRAFNLIPDDAIVSAQTIFLPHLSYRNHIYQFPVIHDAQYVVVSPGEQTYPLSHAGMDQMIRDMLDNGAWEAVIKENDFYILKRIVNEPSN